MWIAVSLFVLTCIGGLAWLTRSALRGIEIHADPFAVHVEDSPAEMTAEIPVVAEPSGGRHRLGRPGTVSYVDLMIDLRARLARQRQVAERRADRAARAGLSGDRGPAWGDLVVPAA